MEKRRLSLNRSGGAKNYNNPLKGGPYSAHPVHYNMIENIHLDLDAMDNEIDKALNSTSTKVRQVAHNFTVLQSIYFNTDTRKWVLAQADDKDTIGTHIIVEVIDKDCFVAGLSGTFEVRNTLDLGYWFTSDTVAGKLVDTAPDINNPMIQVIDSNSIRVLDIGIVDNLDSIPASNIIVTNSVTPDYTAPKVGDTMQDITNKVAGLQDKLIYSDILTENANPVEITQDRFGNPLALTDFYLYVYHPAYSAASGLQLTVNDLQTGYDFRNAINSNAIGLYQNPSLVYSFHHIKFKLITFITGIAESFYCLDASLSNYYSQFAIPAVTEVNKISITAAGVRKLPIGTKIEIYRI